MKTVLTLAALCAFAALALCRVIPAAAREARRKLAGRGRLVAGMLAAASVVAMIAAQKPGPSGGRIIFDSLLVDSGSYATNDVLHIAAVAAPAYAGVDFSGSPLMVYYRPFDSTNATDWASLAPQRTFGDLPADWQIANATSYNYSVFLDYIPPAPVHTNGVYLLYGFEIADTNSARSAAFSGTGVKTQGGNE